MKHIKNIASYVLVWAVLIFSATLSASAQTVLNGVKYNLNTATKTAAVSGVTDRYIAEANIPEFITSSDGQQFKVIAIQNAVFKDCSSLKHLTIGSGVATIGAEAFSGCLALTELCFVDGLVTIDAKAFQGCTRLTRVELSSTVQSLGSNSFGNCPLQELKINVCNYDANGMLSGLRFNTSAFTNNIYSSCRLIVPKKAEEWYRATAIDGQPNWGYKFKNFETFGTAPDGYSFSPSGLILDYQELSRVKVTLNFADEHLTNVLTKDGCSMKASIVLSDTCAITVDSTQIAVHNNTLEINFSDILPDYKEFFVAQNEEEKFKTVSLKIEGEVLIEEVPFSLTDYFASRRIVWDVALLPSVYDLPAAPTIALDSDPDVRGRYSYDAFQTITLTFDGFDGISFDPKSGSFLTGEIYKNKTLLSTSSPRCSTVDNSLLVTFDIPYDELLVRKASGIEYYDFTLAFSGQIRASDGKNYRFSVPATPADVKHWIVNAEYYPEPDNVSYTPAEGPATCTELADIAVQFDGVQRVSLSSLSGVKPFEAHLVKDGAVISSLSAADVYCRGNVLHLQFPVVDEQLVTIISPDKNTTFDFSVLLSADLLTDGAPCRVQLGALPAAPAADATAETADADVTLLTWKAPHWTVDAHVLDVPNFAVTTPLSPDSVPTTYRQLKSVAITVDNYDKVELMPSEAGSTVAPLLRARLMRTGKYGDEYSVCEVSDVTTEGNVITINFGDKLTFGAVGITPDDDPTIPVELTLDFVADLLFDGTAYRFTVGGGDEGTHWQLEPIVVRKLPTPVISFANDHLTFACGVEGVTYHYAVTNADSKAITTVVAKKMGAGSSIVVPMTNAYHISVYASREGYEDSDVATAKLPLNAAPTIICK